MTGRATAVFVAAWGVGLLVLGALGPVLGETDRVSLSQLPAAALGTFVLAVAVMLLGRRRPEPGEVARQSSVGAATLGLGLVLVGAAAAVGLWLAYLAAPVIVVGLYVLLTEGHA